MSERGSVGLLVTCLIDVFRPEAAEAALSLLRHSGFQVSIPLTQTCCGQPGYNAGDLESARHVARKTIEEFESFDYMVIPSASCAGMVKNHYPGLMSGDQAWVSRAKALATKVFELTEFLTDVAKVELTGVSHAGSVAFHDSCSALRELGVTRSARNLLEKVSGLELVEIPDGETCCGFGGSFCVKYPAISTAMADDKLKHIKETGAGCLTSCDLGCLLHLGGRAKRLDMRLEIMHVAELLWSGVTSKKDA